MLTTSAEETGFPHAQSLIRTRTESLEEGGRESQTREWISSLDPQETSAQRYGELVRGHWGIENGSHRQRDTLWREDHQRMKHHGRAHILASIRQLALWLHHTLKQSKGTKPTKRAKPTSHQTQRLSHNPASALHLLLRDPRE